ncbi:putative metallopeptidase [Natroniella sp. ANB-PHB2]|uniref:putative metallopeptidase n=1 Tax=Natroniella sp. ANB-PHB2 TaxID=3384444 RepID=UPI0038D36BED
MSEKVLLYCMGENNNKSRCSRKKEFIVNQAPEEWYCWQHEYQKYEHPFQLPIGFDYKLDGRLRYLAKRILDKMEDLSEIRDIIGLENIGFVRSYKEKKSQGRTVFAECKKVTGPERAIIPYKFLIIFYDPNIANLSDNQKKIVMYHELRHIGPRENIVPHDIEDFSDIIKEFGIDYLDLDKEVPDILADDYHREVV